jgi:hypothetical protein
LYFSDKSSKSVFQSSARFFAILFENFENIIFRFSHEFFQLLLKISLISTKISFFSDILKPTFSSSFSIRFFSNSEVKSQASLASQREINGT